MDDINKKAHDLQKEVLKSIKIIDLDGLIEQKTKIDDETLKSDFWKDNLLAQEKLKQQAKLAKQIEPWQKLEVSLNDILELSSMNDEALSGDLVKQIDEASSLYNLLKEDLKLNGPYDDHDAILSIYAGAGGTDAQDWTQMLFRMYVRWAEKNDFNIKTIDEAPGDEAGLKNVTFEVSGPFAYGKLKSEHGVHRLVRLSPFNSAGSRETSFAKVDVLPKVDSPEELDIDDKDLRIDVYRSGGHGGQSVNTTDSAVRITHIPTGMAVAIQNERSQLQNRETAMTILRSRLIQLQIDQHREKISELKGPNQSAEWGNQIRSYVLHPYKQVKDLRTKHESNDPEAVLNGGLDEFISAYLDLNSKYN
jgi:peptide chain release factor 2